MVAPIKWHKDLNCPHGHIMTGGKCLPVEGYCSGCEVLAGLNAYQALSEDERPAEEIQVVSDEDAQEAVTRALEEVYSNARIH
jgi:hypothetical protein